MMRLSTLALAGLLVGPTGAASRAAAPAPEPVVVSARWLAAHLNDKNLVLLQTGSERADYASHIPGARYLDQTDFTSGGRDVEWPEAAGFRERLEALGVSNASAVVVYGPDPTLASRLVVTLQATGLSNVRLFVGGAEAWKADGGVLTDAAPPFSPGKLAALAPRPLVVDADFVRAHVGKPGFVVIDARSQATYELGGHIPGSHLLHFTDTLTNDGLKSKADLEALFTQAGVKPGDTVIAYCAVGVVATVTMIAAESLGHPVLLYDGSFSDWSRRGLPIEKIK